jgi:hypothetical protein
VDGLTAPVMARLRRGAAISFGVGREDLGERRLTRGGIAAKHPELNRTLIWNCGVSPAKQDETDGH